MIYVGVCVYEVDFYCCCCSGDGVYFVDFGVDLVVY